MAQEHSQDGILLIVSGPAGSGKTTVCGRLLTEEEGLQRVVTSTSRPPRAGEREGVDYYFFDVVTFQAKIAEGEFYEHARVHSNHYGVLKREVLDKLDAGTDLLLNIDVQGAATFREAAQADPLLKGRVATVFLIPPSMEELERRLRRRGTDESAEIERRLKVATAEMGQAACYDYTIRSTTPEADAEALRAIYRAEKLRVRR